MKKNEMSKLMQELHATKTQTVEACHMVQMTQKVKKKAKPTDPDYATETIESPCARISGEFCGACPYPDKKWRLGTCNLATHLFVENKKGSSPIYLTPITMEVEVIDDKQGKMLNPIKLSKRQSG